MHLGKQAEIVIAEAKLEEAARKLLYKHDAAPVTNHLEALQKLAGRALALEEFIGETVNDLKHLRYGTEGGGEQLRAEVAVLERAMDRCGKLLTDLARLNIEERLAAVREATARMLEQALDVALEASGVSWTEKPRHARHFGETCESSREREGECRTLAVA